MTLPGRRQPRSQAEIPNLPEHRDFIATLAGTAGVVINLAQALEERVIPERPALLGAAAGSIINFGWSQQECPLPGTPRGSWSGV